jgi:hypothetical protein
MLIATVSGLASNLALTVPLGLIVAVGTLGPAAEHWFLPTRTTDAVERRPSDRERARRHRAAKRQPRPHMKGKRQSGR